MLTVYCGTHCHRSCMQSVFRAACGGLDRSRELRTRLGVRIETTIDQDATAAIRGEKPLGRFVGGSIYLDRGHLATDRSCPPHGAARTASARSLVNWATCRSTARLALRLVYTFTVTPLLIILGFAIAVGRELASQTAQRGWRSSFRY